MEDKLNLDLSDLIDLRKGITSNSLIGYFNINLLKIKSKPCDKIRKKFQIDILCIDETKLDCYFQDSLFKTDA